MDNATHYIICTKLCDMLQETVAEYVGTLDRRGVIDFFGLENDNVESYTIQVAGTPVIYGHIKAML